MFPGQTCGVTNIKAVPTLWSRPQKALPNAFLYRLHKQPRLLSSAIILQLCVAYNLSALRRLPEVAAFGAIEGFSVAVFPSVLAPQFAFNRCLQPPCSTFV